MAQPDDALLRFEQRLRQEADRFAEGLRCHLAEAGPGIDALDPAERRERLEALAAEDARLRRKARRGDPGYDLDRHIAIRRLVSICTAPSASVRLRRSWPAGARETRRTARSG